MIELRKELYESIINHSMNEFPKEACGLIAGEILEDKIEVKKVFPMTNLDESSEHYSMDPKEQFAVVKEIRRKNYSLIGNYHSHPFTPSRPSQEDKKLAYDESMFYFILSLQEKDKPVLKAFEIKRQEEVREIEISIV